MKLLLDTNAYSGLKRGHPAVAELVRKAQTILFSAIVAGELLYGFRQGDKFQRNLTELEAFFDHPRVSFLPVSFVTSDRFGRIAASLRKKGKPLPTNDLWIAAQAMESGADLVSFDQHFAAVDGLSWICPTH